MKQKALILILLVFLTTSLGSCKAQINEIPLIIYDYEDLYMRDFETQLLSISYVPDYDIVSYDSKNSQIIQNDIVNEVLQNNPKVIIVNPVDRLGVYPIIQKAEQQGTSIVFINRQPLEEDLNLADNLYYVGARAEQSAELQADIVMDLFGNDPDALNESDKNGDNVIQCVILKGQLGHQDAEIRTEKVTEYLELAGYEVEVLSIESGDFSEEKASLLMEDVIDLYGEEMEVIISNNDAMAIGAIKTLSSNGYFVDENSDGVINRSSEMWFPVIGIDGLPIALDYVEKGYLYGTVYNDSESMALAINELTRLLVSGESLNSLSYEITDGKYIWIDYKIIN